MSKSSRKERRQSLAARRADPASPAQSMPIPVPVPPTASVSMSASASPENSESAYSPAALEALLDQLSAAGGGDTPDSPEFTEFLNSLRRLVQLIDDIDFWLQLFPQQDKGIHMARFGNESLELPQDLVEAVGICLCESLGG